MAFLLVLIKLFIFLRLVEMRGELGPPGGGKPRTRCLEGDPSFELAACKTDATCSMCLDGPEAGTCRTSTSAAKSPSSDCVDANAAWFCWIFQDERCLKNSKFVAIAGEIGLQHVHHGG